LITPEPLQRAWKSELPVTGSVVGELTVKTNDVAFVSDPATDVTLTVKLPVAVEESVEMLSVVEQVGVQEV
jgi:hypothetical protein